MPQKIEHDLSEMGVSELLMAIYITNRRTNDLLAKLLHNLDEDTAIDMMEVHNRGGFWTPDPIMVVGENRTGE